MFLCSKEICVLSPAESCNESFGAARTRTFPFSSDSSYDYIHVHHSWSCENQIVRVESKSGRKKLLSELQYLFPCKLWLKPLAIDGCGEGAWWNRSGQQASLEGVAMTTLRVAPTGHRHTENLSGKRCRYLIPKRASREEGGLGTKNNYNYCMYYYMWQHCKITKALLNPKTDEWWRPLPSIVSCLTSPKFSHI